MLPLVLDVLTGVNEYLSAVFKKWGIC